MSFVIDRSWEDGMRRAILVALGTGAVITSAAGITLGTAITPAPAPARTELERTRISHEARAQQRAQVESRYLEARARCEPLGGAKRDTCFISAHAVRGRALLEIQAPYARS
jgi:hypothetical protein